MFLFRSTVAIRLSAGGCNNADGHLARTFPGGTLAPGGVLKKTIIRQDGESGRRKPVKSEAEQGNGADARCGLYQRVAARVAVSLDRCGGGGTMMSGTNSAWSVMRPDRPVVFEMSETRATGRLEPSSRIDLP